MSRGSGLPSSQESSEFAAYVASITAELSRLARSHQLATLAYLLDIVRLEATGAVRETTTDAMAEGGRPQRRRR